MGWNSWNHFSGNIDETQFKAIADAFVSSGLKDAGYRFLVIDDGWLEAKRDKDSNLAIVTSKFPSGMKALGDYAHARGLKLGIYACPTRTTCMRRAGSFSHEAGDARAFASWGVDFLKYDWCGVQSGEDAEGLAVDEVKRRYVVMREALRATGRPIVYALCEKAQGTRGVVPGTWSDTVGHMWRIGGDIHSDWASITAHADANSGLSRFAGPGGWNDPDMLEVGNGSLSEAENRSHFSLWCIQAAPLMLGNDPSAMTTAIRNILINKEAIAVDQDSAGIQGQRIRGKGALEVWVKSLRNGDKAVLLANQTGTAEAMSVHWTDSLIKWGVDDKVDVRDIWNRKDSLGVRQGISAIVASHDVAMFRLKKPGTSAIRTDAGGPVRRTRYRKVSVTRLFPMPGACPPGTVQPGVRAGESEASDGLGRVRPSF